MCPLLSNLPELSLNQENDYLDLIKKGNTIKFFFDQNFPNINKFKMLALYGEWGSGKTTLMHYLKSKLGEEYNVIIFEAWKYEKDGNLSLSLIDFLLNNSSTAIKEDFQELGKLSTKFLTGMAKGIKFTLPGITFQTNEIFDEIAKEDGKSFMQNSQYAIQKEFEKSFNKFEKRISGKKTNLIFIDDLDRCEPENVLNLLSAIKLFFTLGEKTVYMAGIDKDAVKKAVYTKYNDIIKSEEYLEKVFDYSFSMPKEFDLYKLLHLYFAENNTSEVGKENHVEILKGFFESIKFTNPRHIKKVLNKYEILSQFKYLGKLDNSENNSIPNILHNSVGSILESIFTLFFIILFEHEIDSYNEIKYFEKKNRNIINIYHSTISRGDKIAFSAAISQISILYKNQIWESNFKSFGLKIIQNTTNQTELTRIDNLKKELLYLFAPSDNYIIPGTTNSHFYKQFETSKHQILCNFIKYISANFNLFRCSNKTNFKFEQLFEMCETWL